MSKKYKDYIYVISAVAAAVITAVMAVFNPFYALDSYVTDKLYTKLSGTSQDIIIIGIDEETLAEYGKFELWSRERSADLIEYLYSDVENAPAVTAMDIMYISESGQPADDALAGALDTVEATTGSDPADSVVLGTNVVYRGALETDADGRMIYNTEHIADIEIPYADLATKASLGFTNACIAEDGCVRNAMTAVDVPSDISERYSDLGLFPDGRHESFAYETYKVYSLHKGMEAVRPAQNLRGQYRFLFSGKTGEFQHVSLRAVLAGEVPHEAFRGKIVMVGAYAPGSQDAYRAAIDRGRSMYGVEIHANIVQALMQHKTMLPMVRPVLVILTMAIVAGFLIFARKRKLSVILIVSGVLAGLYMLLGRMLAGGIFGKRMFIPAVYVLLALIIADIYFIIEKYVLERIKRKHTLDVFKKYVAPEVVDNLSKSGDFELHLGGEKRDVAVLFVDIRGFTPLSEGLQPETVVAILNEYLALTTKSILDHKGTLDKFVGDATMAVFNAPFDQEDYIYEAVAAAWDMKAGSKELGERLYREYGKTVGFGVGVNCGVAVVGNIGCDFRMDYTAIGDTVNTAARLEANAKTEQILISEDVYEKIKDRIEATPIGEIPLKGKSNKIMVYSVDSIESTGAAETVNETPAAAAGMDDTGGTNEG